MCFLGVGDNCDLAALYLDLAAHGHDVKVVIRNPVCRGILDGLVEKASDWRKALAWIAEAGDARVVIFEDVRHGHLQDRLRAKGFNVVGGSAFGDRLENDRSFARPEEAEVFLLMERIDGVEMGVGAYFDGEKFLGPACLDWEHKRFFPSDLGELTGEMGTVVTYERSQYLFDRTLGLLEPLLRRNRHHGYVNLNTIVNGRGIWPLELTYRFGYPGFSVLTLLQQIPWSELLTAMCRPSNVKLPCGCGFCAGVVLTVPPFPYEKSQVGAITGLPVLIPDDIDEPERSRLHYYEIAKSGTDLVTAGAYGWAMVATGRGSDIATAQKNANALARRVLIPNIRYRRDIGERLINGDFALVEAWGVLGLSRGVRRLQARKNEKVEFTRRAGVSRAREKQWTL